jgi:hypothetical protein
MLELPDLPNLQTILEPGFHFCALDPCRLDGIRAIDRHELGERNLAWNVLMPTGAFEI